MADQDVIDALATAVVDEYSQAGLTLATAESCTGGWIAKAITDIPGSSACLGYGLVTYSNAAKRSLLGVQPATLESFGAVSESTVREMAEGVLDVSGANCSVAVSGIAGPSGGSAEKPVGTVWFAWSCKGENVIHTDAELHNLSGNRDAVRERAVVIALQGLRARARDCCAKGAGSTG